MQQFVFIHRHDGGWFASMMVGGKLTVTPIVLDRQYLTDWLVSKQARDQTIRQSKKP